MSRVNVRWAKLKQQTRHSCGPVLRQVLQVNEARTSGEYHQPRWAFPKIGVPQMDDLQWKIPKEWMMNRGTPVFSETSICQIKETRQSGAP